MMDIALRNRLEAQGVDVAKGIQAHMGNEDMYERILRLVLSDSSFETLFSAMNCNDPGVIFDISHSLKGTLGNVGVIELNDVVTDICETTRAGSIEGIDEKIAEAHKLYDDLIACIKK